MTPAIAITSIPCVTITADDDAIGWGLNFSTNIKVGPGDSVLKLAVVGGEAIENYMNDGTGDLGFDGNQL